MITTAREPEVKKWKARAPVESISVVLQSPNNGLLAAKKSRPKREINPNSDCKILKTPSKSAKGPKLALG